MPNMSKWSLPFSGAVGIGASVLTTLTFCLPLSAVLSQGWLPMTLLEGMSEAAAAASILLTVWVIGRRRGRQALPLAGIVAGGFILLAALLCALSGTSAAFGGWLIRLAAAAVLGGSAGAIMSIRQKTHGKRRNRR